MTIPASPVTSPSATAACAARPCFQGIYFAGDDVIVAGEVMITSGPIPARLHRPASLPPLRHCDALDAAQRPAA